MTQLYEFTSSLFDPSDEPYESVNNIAGHSVLVWLGVHLKQSGYTAMNYPVDEDWGWCTDVSSDNFSYLIGASNQSEYLEGQIDWMLQVRKHRTFSEKLFRKNKDSFDEPIFKEIERILAMEPKIWNVSALVDSSA